MYLTIGNSFDLEEHDYDSGSDKFGDEGDYDTLNELYIIVNARFG